MLHVLTPMDSCTSLDDNEALVTWCLVLNVNHFIYVGYDALLCCSPYKGQLCLYVIGGIIIILICFNWHSSLIWYLIHIWPLNALCSMLTSCSMLAQSSTNAQLAQMLFLWLVLIHVCIENLYWSIWTILRCFWAIRNEILKELLLIDELWEYFDARKKAEAKLIECDFICWC